MHESIRTTLAEIQDVLEFERAALRTLDLPGIQLATERKKLLQERLRNCAANGPLGDDDRRAVSKVREAALANQLLLVHARSCVRGALALATGQSAEPYAHASSGSAGPLRVNLKG
jgi:hypothetical protein